MAAGAGRWRRAIAWAWLVGGIALGAGWTELAWQERLRGVFLWAAVCGGVLVFAAFVLLPVVSTPRGRVLFASGQLLVALGVATAWFGPGLVLMPLGLLLYAAGAVRARLVPRAMAILVLASLALAVGVLELGWDIVAAELCAGSAMLTGVAIAGSVPDEAFGVRRERAIT